MPDVAVVEGCRTKETVGAGGHHLLMVAMSDLTLVILGGTIGIVGAVAGSVAAGFMALRLEQRRETFARERDSAAEQKQKLAALRLVLEDLNRFEAWLRAADDPGAPGIPFTITSSWPEHRSQLALFVDQPTWEDLTRIHTAMAYLTQLVRFRFWLWAFPLVGPRLAQRLLATPDLNQLVQDQSGLVSRAIPSLRLLLEKIE